MKFPRGESFTKWMFAAGFLLMAIGATVAITSAPQRNGVAVVLIIAGIVFIGVTVLVNVVIALCKMHEYDKERRFGPKPKPTLRCVALPLIAASAIPESAENFLGLIIFLAAAACFACMAIAPSLLEENHNGDH